MQRIKNLFLSFAAIATFALPVLVPASAHAATIAEGIGQGCAAVDSECKTSGNGKESLQKIISGAIDIISYAIGAIAVFMVIFGGFKYLTSGGDSGKVGEAKNTILYALLGLAVVIFARALVSFALGSAISAAK